jgi:hypothetical protein
MQRIVIGAILLSLGVGGCTEYAKAYKAMSALEPVDTVAPQAGQTVYRADECVGAVVNSVCHGTIIPKSATHPTCHGEMIGGKCTGPLF